MTLLMLTRKYPPATGGMEKMSYELTRHLSGSADVRLIAFARRSDLWLPVVYVWFLLRTAFVLASTHVDAVYLMDAVLAPLGVVIKKVYRGKVFVLVHGLDVTFDHPLFQRIVPAAVSKMDRVVCVSEATRRACLARGIPAERTVVIPNGTSDYFVAVTKREARERLGAAAHWDTRRAFLLLSVGRLVERKGFHWFVDRVVPELVRREPDLRYLIVGNGPLAPRLRQVIAARALDDRVTLLTRVDDEQLKLIYRAADVFVAPNVRVPGDMEGFGIVSLEAGSSGLPVVGADLEGLSDVVKGFGRVVPEGDVEGFVRAILADWDLPSPREYVMRHYSWASVANQHLECLHRAAS